MCIHVNSRKTINGCQRNINIIILLNGHRYSDLVHIFIKISNVKVFMYSQDKHECMYSPNVSESKIYKTTK